MNGACAAVVPRPAADCDGNAGNGCEVNTATDVTTAAAAARRASLANGTALLLTGACGSSRATRASELQRLLSGRVRGEPPHHVELRGVRPGLCGAQQRFHCQTGTCAIASCSGFFDNCDKVASNGCETSLATTTHCGACGTSCTNANGTTSCPSGTCVPVCSSGYADCDGNVKNGCEATLVALPPSVNVDSTQWAANFTHVPDLELQRFGQTTIIDSAAGTITSTSCALGTVDFTNNVAQSSRRPERHGGSAPRGLTVSNNHALKLQGDKPIVFLVAGNVLVDSGGKIDAGAMGTTAGPGGSIANQCVGQTGGDGRLASGGADDSGGAGGGAFGTAGGVGGLGNNNSNGTAGAAGAVSSNATLQPLRGGCSGGKGGGSSNASGRRRRRRLRDQRIGHHHDRHGHQRRAT